MKYSYCSKHFNGALYVWVEMFTHQLTIGLARHELYALQKLQTLEFAMNKTITSLFTETTVDTCTHSDTVIRKCT